MVTVTQRAIQESKMYIQNKRLKNENVLVTFKSVLRIAFEICKRKLKILEEEAN